jgi:hypothetical protein
MPCRAVSVRCSSSCRFSPSPHPRERTSSSTPPVVKTTGEGLTDGQDGTYCRFTVDGKSKDVRASGQVRLISTGATLSVVPAQ